MPKAQKAADHGLNAEATLALIGMTREEFREVIIDRAVSNIDRYFGNEDWADTGGHKHSITAHIRGTVQKCVDAYMVKNIDPIVKEKIETIVFEATNRWGERIEGAPKKTFREFLIDRAEKFLREEVDYEGKTREDKHGSYWTKSQSRVSHLVHQYLHYKVESAMKDAVKNANTVIVAGIEETVRIKLAEVAAALKVEVKTK